MSQQIRIYFTSLAVGLLVAAGVGFMLPTVTLAAPGAAAKQACEGVTSISGGGSCSGSDSADKVNNLTNTLINIFSWVIGVVAVIMIIFGGYLYVTSGGDSAKTKTARDTIMYSIVGLIIVVLAQTIVKFVIGKFAK